MDDDTAEEEEELEWEWECLDEDRLPPATSHLTPDIGYPLIPPPLRYLSLDAPCIDNLSSAASSPVSNRNFYAAVVADQQASGLDVPHRDLAGWIEPQVVFLESNLARLQSSELCNVSRLLRGSSAAKEALISVLSDPAVWDAVMNNKSMDDLLYHHHDNHGKASISENMDDSPFFYNRGRQVYRIMKEMLPSSISSILSYLETRYASRDELDATVKSCTLLVGIVVFIILSERTNMSYR